MTTVYRDNRDSSLALRMTQARRRDQECRAGLPTKD